MRVWPTLLPATRRICTYLSMIRSIGISSRRLSERFSSVSWSSESKIVLSISFSRLPRRLIKLRLCILEKAVRFSRSIPLFEKSKSETEGACSRYFVGLESCMYLSGLPAIVSRLSCVLFWKMFGWMSCRPLRVKFTANRYVMPLKAVRSNSTMRVSTMVMDSNC